MNLKLITLSVGALLLFPQIGWSQSTVANNFQLGTQPRFLGFQNNFDVLVRTNNFRRIRLNSTKNYAVNGYLGNQSGYMLLGHDQGFSNNLFNVQNNNGAFSLLHLNGRDGTFVQEGGFRPWMKAGITLTDNNDLSYMGLRKVGTGNDITETTITWSDNAGGSFPGPDDMVFRFTSGGNGNTTISNDLNTTNDLDGRHIARFAPTGEFGLGNTFGVNPVGTPPNLYVRPQSLLHMSLDQSKSVWAQFTNQQFGQGVNNGIRMGLLGNANAQQNGIGLMYNQNNRHLLFSTNANTGNISPTNTRERMRITAVSAPTALPTGGYGNYNPGGIIGNRTRVSISHNPNNPVTRPMSLLHLGYNVGSPFLPGSLDGWRDWMDVGMFTAQGTDNMYVGLKEKGNDRFDAIINWGDNQGPSITGPVGPDYLRFIFTSSATSFPPGDPVSGSNDGLEVARMDPSLASTLPNDNYGMVGIKKVNRHISEQPHQSI